MDSSPQCENVVVVIYSTSCWSKRVWLSFVEQKHEKFSRMLYFLHNDSEWWPWNVSRGQAL